MALDYDFWLDTLGFNKAISTDRPYERATAQFRKDQLDSTATVGDQSLTGWWTRGQLSFHKGAGVKYYEVLGSTDTTVENRFHDSVGVDVWTPGEATLTESYTPIPLEGVLDVVPADTATVSPSAGSIANGGFETNASGWESNNVWGFYTVATFARSTAKAHTGTASLLATWPTTSGATWVNTDVTGLTPGASYDLSTWVWTASGNPDPRLEVLGVAQGSGAAVKDGWAEITVTFVASATSHKVGIRVDNSTAGQTCYIDDVTVSSSIVPTGVAALLSNGQIQYVGTEPAAIGTSYTAEGVLALDSLDGTLVAATPSAVERAGGGTSYQYVKNPAFDNGGDKTWAAAVGGTTSMTWTGSALTYTTASGGVDGVEFTVGTVSSPATRTNLVTNPSFEADTSDWSGTAGTSAVRTTAASSTGSASCNVYAAAGTTLSQIESSPIPVTAGLSYALQARIRRQASVTTAIVTTIAWFNNADGSGTPASTSQFTSSGALGLFAQVGGVATAPVGALSARVRAGFSLPSSTAQYVGYVDSVLFEKSATLGSYFDGDTASSSGVDYTWEGTPHASRSLAVPSSAVKPVLVRVKLDKNATVKVYNGATYDTVATATAGVRCSFYTTGDTAGVVKVRVISDATGATSLSEFTVSSSLAETDGATPVTDSRWSWTGTTNASIQSRTVVQGGLTVLWVPPLGGTWAGVWCAKGRLLAVDNLGRWFDLSAREGGVVDPADAFWASGESSGWSVSESPSGVYLSRGNAVYKLTIDTSGLLPTVAAPTVAALLPVNESISSTYCYLGYLILCTSRGVRAAIVQGDGSLIYGPRFIEGDFSGCARIAVDGDNAYVTGVPDEDGDSAVYSVNLATFVDDLSPAYARWLDVQETPFGGTLGSDGVVYFFDSTGLLRRSTTLSSTGHVTTGFHRLGTLEPKSFRSVRVRTEGTEGSVAVSATLPDGSSYSVGTVSAGNTADFDLGTVPGFPASAEYLSLTFTLNRGTTTGPTLLGYQLKALPVPKRQRMIRVPLMLFDAETNRLGELQYTDPWTRLAALEALEESSAVVSFEDKETGETGSGFIEAVEVSRTAPAGPAGAVGGFIYVTLRRI